MSAAWFDLRARAISAAVMLVVGVAAIWAGGMFFAELVVVAGIAMLWELVRIYRAAPALRGVAVLFAAGIIAACGALIALNGALGRGVIVWLVGVVIMSDIAGYFAGRTLGGPKFWPAISPKKTWSGTVAGWIGAGGLGAVFWALGQGHASLIVLSPIVAFAGQMGDIAESWLKRRAGIKDSSNLIPGHGGVMDRFDALVGAALLVLAIHALMPQLLAFGG